MYREDSRLIVRFGEPIRPDRGLRPRHDDITYQLGTWEIPSGSHLNRKGGDKYGQERKGEKGLKQAVKQ